MDVGVNIMTCLHSQQIWNVAAQFRNEVKKKGKSVVEHSYGLSNLTVTQRLLLAQWLLKTHPMKMKVKGSKREIPNFVFGDMKIAWNTKDKLDKEVRTIWLDVFAACCCIKISANLDG